MNLAEITKVAQELPFDEQITIYKSQGYEISFFRPSKLSARFKHYDINTNFQIYLKEPNQKPYKPNHLRLLFDLYFLSRENPDKINDILEAFDKIFYGKDALAAVDKLASLSCKHSLSPIDINAILALSFIIEQNIGYGNKSKFSPPSLYIQGWIRTFIDSDKPLDQLCYRICRNTPPAAKYTCKDNAYNKRYTPNNTVLWYKQL